MFCLRRRKQNIQDSYKTLAAGGACPSLGIYLRRGQTRINENITLKLATNSMCFESHVGYGDGSPPVPKSLASFSHASAGIQIQVMARDS